MNCIFLWNQTKVYYKKLKRLIKLSKNKIQIKINQNAKGKKVDW